MVPRGVQEALERLQKIIQKNMFFFTQTGPYDLPGGLPDSPPLARPGLNKKQRFQQHVDFCFENYPIWVEARKKRMLNRVRVEGSMI